MGLEYKIKFEVEDKVYYENFLEKLGLEITNEITILLENDGIYFCDNCTNSPLTSKIFYRLVREVLTRNSEIKIYEL